MEDVGADAGGQFAVFHFQIVFVKTETVVHVQILVRVGIDTTDIVTETPVFIITGSKTFFIAEFVALSDECLGASHNSSVRTPVDTVTDAAAGIVAVVAGIAVDIKDVGVVEFGVLAVFIGNLVYFIAAVRSRNGNDYRLDNMAGGFGGTNKRHFPFQTQLREDTSDFAGEFFFVGVGIIVNIIQI